MEDHREDTVVLNLEIHNYDHEENIESSDNLLDLYSSHEILQQEENRECNSGLPTKKRKLPSKIKFDPERSRKLKGMKASELLRILDGDVLKFCQDNGLLATSATCLCGKQMTLIKTNEKKVFCSWKCRKSFQGKNCDRSFSLRKGTWFENSKLSVSDILWLAYMWVHEYSYISLLHECDHSTHTVVEWLSACRDVCQAIMEHKAEPLGGTEKLVKIFECNCTGKGPENLWVFCALEQGSCRSVLVFVKDNKSKTIVQIFDQYILPGSTVLTNIWSAFKNLNIDDFSYLMYKKSITFFDTVKNAEIHSIEVMKEVASRPTVINGWTKYEYGTKFCETMYRKSLKFSEDAYITFLQDVAKIYVPVTTYTKKEKKVQIKKEVDLENFDVDRNVLLNEDKKNCDISTRITHTVLTTSPNIITLKNN